MKYGYMYPFAKKRVRLFLGLGYLALVLLLDRAAVEYDL